MKRDSAVFSPSAFVRSVFCSGYVGDYAPCAKNTPSLAENENPHGLALHCRAVTVRKEESRREGAPVDEIYKDGTMAGQ